MGLSSPPPPAGLPPRRPPSPLPATTRCSSSPHARSWGNGGRVTSGCMSPWVAPRRATGARARWIRGRKPGAPRTDEPAISHVDAERQRRDKLYRLFCELRAAAPTVSRMDKASILADATAYIAELRGRVEQLEAKARDAVARHGAPPSTPAMTTASHSFSSLEDEGKLEVRMVGPEAAARHAPARLMDALLSLDLPVRHACICRVGGVTVQDAVVDVHRALLDCHGIS
uniref:Transcription factor n=1 Tax=Setaria viridis TaxID=4556 RepID=A0A4U6U777_SETVI|nr:hypothetical protein SEVIR_6G240000v2 [Setaria viridis]